MLSPREIESIAEAVVQRMTPRVGPVLTVAEVAKRLRVDASWVYEHSAELGAIRLGTGTKPRLRFDERVVADYIDACRSKKTAIPHSQFGQPTTLRRRRRQLRA